jgi:hypothetical protein
MKNPCRNNAFDAYPGLLTSETDLRRIRSAIRNGKAAWTHAGRKVIGRNGVERQVSEAEMLKFEKELLDPIERLQVEQFVHREHSFSLDEEIMGLLEELSPQEREEVAFPSEVLGQVRRSIVDKLTAYLPEPSPEPVADDELAWPDPPGPLELRFEDYEETILRDR